MELFNTFFVGLIAGSALLVVTQQLYRMLKQYVASLFDFEDYAKSIYIGERPAPQQAFHFGVPVEAQKSQQASTRLQAGRVTS